jgi:hypothetical protein
MEHHHDDSLRPILDAVGKSRRASHAKALIWTAVKWVLVVGVSSALTWVTAKLDMKLDLARLQEAKSALELRVTLAESKAKDQGVEIQKLQTDVIVGLVAESRNVARSAVMARAMAIAGETQAKRKAKVAAGESLARSYDRILADKKSTVSAAIEATFAQIAVP